MICANNQWWVSLESNLLLSLEWKQTICRIQRIVRICDESLYAWRWVIKLCFSNEIERVLSDEFEGFTINDEFINKTRLTFHIWTHTHTHINIPSGASLSKWKIHLSKVHCVSAEKHDNIFHWYTLTVWLNDFAWAFTFLPLLYFCSLCSVFLLLSLRHCWPSIMLCVCIFYFIALVKQK